MAELRFMVKAGLEIAIEKSDINGREKPQKEHKEEPPKQPKQRLQKMRKVIMTMILGVVTGLMVNFILEWRAGAYQGVSMESPIPQHKDGLARFWESLTAVDE